MSGGRGGRYFALLIVLFIAAMSMLGIAASVDGVHRNGPGAAILALMAGGGVLSMLAFGPIGRAIARLIDGEIPGTDPQLQERVVDLEERLFYLSNEVQRLQDIEQRMEFTERLLARPPYDAGRET